MDVYNHTLLMGNKYWSAIELLELSASHNQYWSSTLE